MLFWEDFMVGLRTYYARLVRVIKILFQSKKLRMSTSINNDVNEGKFIVLIYNDSHKFRMLFEMLPDLIESPCILIASIYFIFKYMGWYGFIALFLTVMQLFMGYKREKVGKDIRDKQRKKYTETISYIKQTFQNIKGIKLYGWEDKIIEHINKL